MSEEGRKLSDQRYGIGYICKHNIPGDSCERCEKEAASSHIAILPAVNSINHPPYYNTGNIEVIDFIEDQQLDFHLGNAVKYICRAGKKVDVTTGKVSDLQKAVWYLQRVIERTK